MKAGAFCYVLNSRQMGKSSLRVRVMQRLQAEGVACAVIDLTRIGSENITPDQWYVGIARSLVSGFNLTETINLRSWWRDRDHLSSVQRLSELIDALLRLVDANLVIFLDEIDTVLDLKFSVDDFFAFIRGCYNDRADKPTYNRLTFALLGVATPSDLIRQKRGTPFNIGRAIELTGFQFSEAAEPLAPGLANKATEPQTVLREILAWTGGQPFLTQKLCNLVQTDDAIAPGNEATAIEALVRSRVIENWETHDDPVHLRTIRDRLIRNESRATRLLEQYRRILQMGEIPADTTPEQMELRLAGLVVVQKGNLVIYNSIYKSVFNENWINRELANLQIDNRINAIIEEIRQTLKEGSRLIGDIRDPGYLMRMPYIWRDRYPCHSEGSRLPDSNLAVEEKQLIEEKLKSFSSDIPEVRLITFPQLISIIEHLHTQAQEEDVPQELWLAFSQNVAENVVNRLISSGTVAQINLSNNLNYYLLTRASYTSLDDKERSYVLVGDTAQYFRLLKDWQQKKKFTMRVLEEFSIPKEHIDQALYEIDIFIRGWADKYHNDNGIQMILQMAVGQQNEDQGIFEKLT